MHHFLLLSEFCNDLPLCSQNHQPQSGIGKMRVDVLLNLTKNVFVQYGNQNHQPSRVVRQERICLIYPGKVC